MYSLINFLFIEKLKLYFTYNSIFALHYHLMLRKTLYFLVTIFFLACSSSDSTQDIEVTIDLPSVSTTAIKDLTENSVTIEGDVTSDGGSNVTKRGVVWDLISNPTISDNNEEAQSGTGQFSVSLTGLQSNTTYFARTYAVNGKGTVYGNEQQFTTLEAVPQQKVFEGDVALTTQKEVDDFGSFGYTHVIGTINVSDATAPASERIVDLSNLESLVAIDGDLRFLLLYSLEKFSGLKNLTSVSGDLIINNVPLLTEINGFESLEMVEGELGFNYNDNLNQVDNFPKLTEVGHLAIGANSSLLDIDFLKVLETVNGQIAIGSNDSLVNISGLNGVKTARYIIIEANPSLLNIDGFIGLENMPTDNAFLKGEIWIAHNSSLTTLNGFTNLISMNDTLTIANNQKLESFSGFIKLEDCGHLFIQNNESLVVLSNFPSLKEIKGVCYITGNTILETILGFENITRLEDIIIKFNNNLTQINAFNSLMEVTGSLEIDTNYELNNLEAFVSLESVNVSFVFKNNNLVENLSNFQNISSIPGNVEIIDNQMLANFCALTNVFNTNLAETCIIEGNNFNPTCEDIANGVCSD